MLTNESVLIICSSNCECYTFSGHCQTLTEASIACKQLAYCFNQCNVQFCCNGDVSSLRNCLMPGLNCGGILFVLYVISIKNHYRLAQSIQFNYTTTGIFNTAQLEIQPHN